MEKTKEKLTGRAYLAAFGMALLGGIVYGLLYYFEIIAYLSTLLIFWLAALGFKKVKNCKTLQKKEYVLLALITLAVITIAMVVALWVMVLNIGIPVGESFSILLQVLADTSVIMAIGTDLLFGAIFVTISAVSLFFVEKRNNKKAANAQTQDSQLTTDAANENKIEENPQGTEENTANNLETEITSAEKSNTTNE